MTSLLLVNYRAAGLAAEAIRSARASCRQPLHVVAVDNSLDDSEARRLREDADLVVVAPRNSGYAGGINLGRPHCRGEIVIVTNPDVVFAEGAIDHLLAAFAGQRVAVAGPALFWDAQHRWLLPPADEGSLLDKAGEALASRSRSWARRRDRARIRRRLSFWSLREVTRVGVVSGAVMAIRLRDFDRAGGFDERFPLYFEEIDFLRRVRRGGGEVVYVPAARCRHIYDQSAGTARAHAVSAFGASEVAYLEKWYGRAATRVVTSLGRRRGPENPVPHEPALVVPAPGLVVEASPLPSFATAAGLLSPPPEVDLPPEVWESFRGEAVYLRAVDPATASAVATCVLTPLSSRT